MRTLAKFKQFWPDLVWTNSIYFLNWIEVTFATPASPYGQQCINGNSDESTFVISKSHATPTHFLNEIEKNVRPQIFGKTQICPNWEVQCYK